MPLPGLAQFRCHREMTSHHLAYTSQVRPCNVSAALILTKLLLLRHLPVLESNGIAVLDDVFFVLAERPDENIALCVTPQLPWGQRSRYMFAMPGLGQHQYTHPRMTEIFW